MYLGPSCYDDALNCHLVYLAIPETRPLCMKKQNLFCFISIQPQKVKFKYVQINMKQVSYYFTGSRIEQMLSKNIIHKKFCDCGEIEDSLTNDKS